MTDTFTPRTPSNAPDTHTEERKGAVTGREGGVSDEKGKNEERGFHKHRDRFFGRHGRIIRGIQGDCKFKGDASGLAESIPTLAEIDRDGPLIPENPINRSD